MQAARELGYYGYDTKPFKKYLSIQPSKGYLHRLMLPEELKDCLLYTSPLPPVCIEALHKAVEEMADVRTFRGYGPEQGYDFLIEALSLIHILLIFAILFYCL